MPDDTDFLNPGGPRSTPLPFAGGDTNSLFRGTLDCAPVGVANVSLEGRWLRVNPKLCDMLGYSQTEMLRLKFQHITHPDDVDKSLHHMKSLLAGEVQEYQIDKRYFCKNGKILWVSLTVSAQRDQRGSPIYFVAIIQDINQRKQTERTLRLASERFELVLDSSGISVSSQDKGLKYIWAHDSRPGSGSVRGKSEYDFLPAGQAEELLLAKQQVLESEVGLRREFWLQYHGTEKKCYDIYIEPFYSLHGKLEGITCASIDITKRKQAEEHQHILVKELSHRTKNLITVIQSIARQTAQSSENTDEFIGKFEGRLMALSRSHSALGQTEWQGVSLKNLLAGELSGIVGKLDNKVVLDGPELSVRAAAVQSLCLGLHELATNATKYGALATSTGKVHISWSLVSGDFAEGGIETGLVITWSESGGLPVELPKRRGFGHTILEYSIERSLQGKIALDFKQEGLMCTIQLPEDCVSSGPVKE